MKYKLLGKSGLKVSEICLGAMTIGEDWGWGANKEISKKIFDYYVNQGGNFIDSAINYTNGTSEKYVGEFISSDRDYFVLATKYTMSTKEGDPNRCGNSRKNMMHSIEKSLKQLKTDYIDLYWVHAWDGITPEEEVMRGLDDLVHSGKVRYIGLSDAPAWYVSRCNTLAELRGWNQFVALQLHYSLIIRDIERELLPYSKIFDLSIATWGTLGAGFLTGKFTKDSKPEDSADSRLKINPGRREQVMTEKNLAIAEETAKIAKEIGKTSSQVALNWARQKSFNIIPIIGARKIHQIEDDLAALDFQLTAEQMKRLDEISDIKLGFPYDFVSSEFGKNILTGGTHSKIINHRAR